MTLSNLKNAPASHTSVALPGELIDAITDAVVWTPDPITRAGVICSLIHEMYETTGWAKGSHPSCPELASLRQVLKAAEEHQQRMHSATSGTR